MFFYKHNKDQYKNKIIEYTDSPTGRAYVGINKAPFMPNDNGIGFKGVVIQDENRELIQCSGCGKWKKKITNLHTKSCLGITVKEYKTKFCINDSTSLVSDQTSLALTQVALRNNKSKKFKNPFKDKTTRPKGKHGRSKKHSMEYFNKFGTCPLQLRTRLYEFIRCNRELPSSGNKGRSIYTALRKRYGSFGHALAVHGLPYMTRVGTNMRYAFSDGTVYRFNINQFHDREELFNLIMQKCPALSESKS